MRKTIFLIFCVCSLLVGATNSYQPAFSVAGFYPLKDTGRDVYSMNPAWRFHKGSAEGAWKSNFDDKNWSVVNLPDGIEPLPEEASGCVNYQGEVWYRKRFTPAKELMGKKLFLHFEAIMGKCKVWVNGEQVAEHFGGFLPVIADVTGKLKVGQENVIAVCADNSDDPSYPPGKPQDVLDFAYFGGIYRDCWLIAHEHCYITDPNFENEVAGGGLFVSYANVSEKQADLNLKLHIRNDNKQAFSGKVVYELLDPKGNVVKRTSEKVSLAAGKANAFVSKMKVEAPKLWSPDTPYLYNLNVRVQNANGKTVDGYMRRIGIRSIEFKGKDGFWLNGKPYGAPLVGANRHQDFAVVGNAQSNSMHWRDAKKLRDAGLKVIRNAHYPQDPAFMDACDELGLFVIVNTPGWQFWNEAPIFAQRVHNDIRNMVRRDRNHPSVWMWEPILNETWYPVEFAKEVKETVEQEYPYPYCYSGCDATARGSEYYNVLFAHPQTGAPGWGVKELDPKVTYFTREWGDNVDDWNSHNSTSRVARGWGEVPMLIQAQHYADPKDYQFTCWESFYKETPQHVGGCLWHSFDHQRGYHPDPFYGGLMDAFRQPKYSYYMFMAQRPVEKTEWLAGSGPMVYIAHEMTPFSPKDVTVYSNCEEVRLTVFKDGKQYTYKRDPNLKGMPSPVITFKDVYDFMADKALARKNKQNDVFMLAEGIQGGKVVATHEVRPSRRPAKIILEVDNEGLDLHADGSDMVTVVASIADANGVVKHLNDSYISFSIEGEGSLVGDPQTMNPQRTQWGSVPMLVKATTNPGKIKIKAFMTYQGKQAPISGELEIETKQPQRGLIFDKNEESLTLKTKQENTSATSSDSDCAKEVERLRQELNQYKLKAVEKQQTDFGGEVK